MAAYEGDVTQFVPHEVLASKCKSGGRHRFLGLVADQGRPGVDYVVLIRCQKGNDVVLTEYEPETNTLHPKED